MTTRARARSRSWAAPAASVSNREITERTLHPNVEPAVPAGGPRQSPAHGRGSLEFSVKSPDELPSYADYLNLRGFWAVAASIYPHPHPSAVAALLLGNAGGETRGDHSSRVRIRHHTSRVRPRAGSLPGSQMVRRAGGGVLHRLRSAGVERAALRSRIPRQRDSVRRLRQDGRNGTAR